MPYIPEKIVRKKIGAVKEATLNYTKETKTIVKPRKADGIWGIPLDDGP